MSQSLSYIRPDEEFFGAIKLMNGEEIIGKIVVSDEEGGHMAFIQDPAKVHANDTMSEGKRAVAVGCLLYTSPSPRDKRGSRFTACC